MGDNEEYFPRGGKKPTVLFKKSSNFLGAPEKTMKKKKKPKKKGEGDDGYLSDEETRAVDASIKNCAIGLNYKTVKAGVLVLGRVRYVQETRVVVMLPCRLIGNIMACHVSEAYNKVLEAYVNDQTEKVPELKQMFRPGQYIAVKVLEVTGQGLMLSTMPQHVNGAKIHADIVKGALFQCAVSSVEDHGYVMDIGIPDTRAFLPKSELNPELELDVGMVTWCAVKAKSSSDSSVVTLTTSAGYVQGGVLRHKQNTPLLPATTVEFTVDTPLENGIEGTIFGDTTCYIQRQHVDKVKGKKPALGQKIRARVLYVVPTRNCPFLTMKNIFEKTHPDLEEEQAYKEGDIIEEAQVMKVLGRSVHLKLSRGHTGVLSLRRVQAHHDLDDEEVVRKSYPVGSSHRVRVTCYNMSDYVYSVSDAPEVVQERYFSLRELRAGQLVPATVRDLKERVIELTVGRVKGFVPEMHVTDSGLYVDPKKPHASKLAMKKYKVGQSVTARVLKVDLEKQQLVLTLKPSLLAPELDVLSSYEQAVVGRQYVGVVRFVKDYLLLTFFNEVRAYIPNWFVTAEARGSLADSFHLGQILTCTVVSSQPDQGKLVASLITKPFVHDENRVKPNRNKRKHTLENSEEAINEQKSEEEIKEPKKKKKKNKQAEDEVVVTEVSEPKKKKKRSDTETSQENIDNEKSSNESKKKKKKRTDTESSQDNDQETKHKKKKNSVSEEESDPIDTDFQEEELLTPHEQGLIDFSDCETIKDYRKRIASLLKSIGSRARRTDVIDKKIATIEEKGLTAKNKKYHTAMHSEKLQIQERTNKLLEALKIAQDKIKEMAVNRDDSYKEEQKKRRKEKAKLKKLEKKQAKKEQSNETDAKVVSKDEVSNVVKEGLKDKIKGIKVLESLEPALDLPSAKDFWSASYDVQEEQAQPRDSSSSEDESKEQPKKKRKKLSVAEKLAKAREEEERVRALERAAAESEAQPRSVEQFERSVLAHPASSQLWIAYMAFHLQATELDKARAVAKKALNTIPFREEQEKLNVWLALINLEQRFGTKESQQKTLEDALQLNDPYRVHASLLDILVDTGKQQELTTLVDLMMRKYKRNPEMYIKCGGSCFKLGLVEKARQVMQKAIAVLEKKEHVHVLVQFALLERDAGGRERAEALFEQVLAVYPQRVDVCAVYVDMLTKAGDVDQARQVLERMTSQKLAARKMKSLYKKWVEVEERHGDEARVENIKQRAMEFIEKAQF